MHHSLLASATLALLAHASTGMAPLLPPPVTQRPARPGASRRYAGSVSINYSARAARSHRGKPAGYVKAY